MGRKERKLAICQVKARVYMLCAARRMSWKHRPASKQASKAPLLQQAARNALFRPPSCAGVRRSERYPSNATPHEHTDVLPQDDVADAASDTQAPTWSFARATLVLYEFSTAAVRVTVFATHFGADRRAGPVQRVQFRQRATPLISYPRKARLPELSPQTAAALCCTSFGQSKGRLSSCRLSKLTCRGVTDAK